MAIRKIKFIWDFFGEDAQPTAAHHAKHLETYFTLNKVEFEDVGAKELSSLKSIAFVVASEDKVEMIKKDLKPHRATIES
ncbi:MAG: hypothetical protein AB8B72_08650 [Crocinitomicaceae bacterium]